VKNVTIDSVRKIEEKSYPMRRSTTAELFMEYVHIYDAHQHYTMNDDERRRSNKTLPKCSGPGLPGAVDTATVFTSCNAFLSFQEP
jgi:hypothetical protein